MPTSFAKAINNIATTITAGSSSPHDFTTGGGFSLAVASTTGITLSAGQWVRVSVFRAGSPIAIFKADQVTDSTHLRLTGMADSTPDATLANGDAAELRVTAGAFTDIHTAVNTLETGGGGGDMMATFVNAQVSVTGAASLAYDTMHYCSGTSANYAITLPTPALSGGKPQLVGVRMVPGLTKLVSLTPHGSEKIDGVAAPRVMWANESAILMTDGTDWFKIGGKSVPMFCAIYQGSGTMSCPNGSIVGLPLKSMKYDNTGLMANTTLGCIYIVRGGTYAITDQLTCNSGVGQTGVVSACVYQAPPVTFTSGGTGYTNGNYTNGTITDPSSGPGSGATFSYTVTGTSVVQSSIVITSFGNNLYAFGAPVLNISAGGGSGFSATGGVPWGGNQILGSGGSFIASAYPTPTTLGIESANVGDAFMAAIYQSSTGALSSFGTAYANNFLQAMEIVSW